MKHLILTTSILALSATLSLAAGTHSGGHGHEQMKTEDGHGHGEGHAHGHGDGHGHGHMTDMMEVGMPGDRANVSRTVEIRMHETEDGDMLFKPSNLSFEAGETILFKIRNDGAIDHEFVMDTMGNNEKHRELMMKFPEMEHDDPNSVTLTPGASGEIVWTFSNPGEFQFACLIPGHMESGMHGPINVASN